LILLTGVARIGADMEAGVSWPPTQHYQLPCLHVTRQSSTQKRLRPYYVCVVVGPGIERFCWLWTSLAGWSDPTPGRGAQGPRDGQTIVYVKYSPATPRCSAPQRASDCGATKARLQMARKEQDVHWDTCLVFAKGQEHRLEPTVTALHAKVRCLVGFKDLWLVMLVS